MHNNIYSEKVVIEILIEVLKVLQSVVVLGGGGGPGGPWPPRFFLLRPYLFTLGYIVLKCITIQLKLYLIYTCTNNNYYFDYNLF